MVTTSGLTEELDRRLRENSSLDERCHLALRTFLSPVFIPGKEDTIMTWILETLDKKYKNRLASAGEKSEEFVLWRTLLSCLHHLEQRALTIDVSRVAVPEILSNLLPVTDLSEDCVASSISLLLALSLPSQPSHPLWVSVICSVLSSSSQDKDLISSVQGLLVSLEVEAIQDPLQLVRCLSDLHLTQPHPVHQKITSRLLFPNAEPYINLFHHLSSSDEKYKPDQVVSLLLSLLTMSTPPHLLLQSCPANPPWLKPKLLSLLLSCSGCPGIFSANSVLGARILSETRLYLDVGGLVRDALPLDLSLEMKPGYLVSEYLTDVARHLAVKQGVSGDLEQVVTSLHRVHPQLLEPLVPLLTVRLLEDDQLRESQLFSQLLDVQIKLRQVPKMISKLFLQMRSSQSTSVSWRSWDLQLLGSTISSLPKVQSLEIWKSLNYHFSSDVIEAKNEEQVDATSNILGPIFKTVLTNSQLADHNLSSTLVPRVQDLMGTTFLHLKKLKSREILSASQKKLLFDVTCAITDLSSLLAHYRNFEVYEGLATFGRTVAQMLSSDKENLREDWNMRSFVLRNSPTEKYTKKSSDLSVGLLREIEFNPDLINSLSETVFLKLLEENLPGNCSLLENPHFCAGILYKSLTELNKEETLYIPDFSYWRTTESYSQLDSYLGKSMSSALTSVIHSCQMNYSLSEEHLQRLRQLHLKHLPPVLKLSASLVFISLLLSAERRDERLELDCCQCLETTDLFRFIDAGLFLNKILSLNVSTDLLEVVSKSAGRFNKGVIEIERYFEELQKNDEKMRASLCLLNVLGMTLDDENVVTEKKVSSRALAHKISNFVLMKFKTRNLEDEEELDIFCQLASCLLNLNNDIEKLSALLSAVIDATLSEKCKSWKGLIKSVCENHLSLTISILPPDWRVISLKMLLDEEDKVPEYGLLKDLFKTASANEIQSIMHFLTEKNSTPTKLWIQIIHADVAETCVGLKRDSVEKAVWKICSDLNTADPSHVSDLFRTIFSSSPPCVSQQLEISCLGRLYLLPPNLASESLSSLSVFMSHRSKLSTRVIPLILSIIRHIVTQSPATVDTLQSLQKVLGLLSRHKTDYAPVISFLLADLLNMVQSLAPRDRGIITSSIYPLLDCLEKHNLTYLSTNLPPATTELFKLLLGQYNANNKFKGKV